MSHQRVKKLVDLALALNVDPDELIKEINYRMKEPRIPSWFPLRKARK